ncbi:MAG: ABC transporter permease [Rhodoferax sp.]|nr:ABC transporter permease [Rhodoferax sp.]
MTDQTPSITRSNTPDGAGVRLSGCWSAARLAEPATWLQLQTGLSGCSDATATSQGTAFAWDLRELQRLDHTGAQLLWNAWNHQWPVSVLMNDAQKTMLERVARYSVAAPVAKRISLFQMFLKLGAGVWQVLDHLWGMVRLLGQLLLDTLKMLRAPSKAPWRDLSGHLYHIGATALPITALVGFLIGVVLAYLMSQQLRQFGADAFIVNILGVTLIRELGPVLAAILIAGRSGSAITAQIGVMRVTEELDAMRVMGIAKGYRLVLPRAMALALAMPLLAVWTTLSALLGGMLAADLAMGVTPAYFFAALPRAVQVSNLTLAVGKSVVFGILIALIGCHYGLRVKPNTESLGQGTTASVVTSITMVILVDALFAVVFKSVGI